MVFSRYRHGLVYPLSLSLILFEAFFSFNTKAADIRVTPSLDIRETFTDNVTLATSNNETSDFVSIITPSLSIIKEGKNTETKIYYSLQNIFYLDRGDNKHLHLVNIGNSSNLFEDKFFIDLNLQNSQQNVSNSGNRSTDNISISSDRENVLTYGISPYWHQRISNITDIELKYTKNDIKSDSLDSQSNEYEFHASNGERYNRLLWDIDYNYEDISVTTQEDIILSTIIGSFRYLVTNNFAVLVDIGYDDNDYQMSNGDIEGELWNLGVEWNPSRRTSFKLKYGERYFGTNGLIEFSHSTRKSRILFSYSETPDTSRSRLLDQQAFRLTDAFGDRIGVPSLGSQEALNLSGSDQFSEVFIKKKYRIVYNINLRRNTFLLQIEGEDRDFRTALQDESEDSLRLSWGLNHSRLMRSQFNYSWIRSQSRSNNEEEYIQLKYEITKTLTSLLNVNAGISYTDKQSSNNASEYNEFRVFAGINKIF